MSWYFALILKHTEALAQATITTHLLPDEISTLKAKCEAIVKQVDDANERNQSLLIKHHPHHAE